MKSFTFLSLLAFFFTKQCHADKFIALGIPSKDGAEPDFTTQTALKVYTAAVFGKMEEDEADGGTRHLRATDRDLQSQTQCNNWQIFCYAYGILWYCQLYASCPPFRERDLQETDTVTDEWDDCDDYLKSNDWKLLTDTLAPKKEIKELLDQVTCKSKNM